MKIKICIVCGKEFSVSDYREHTAKFCGRVCGGKWYYTHRPKMIGPSLVGNKYRLGLVPYNKGIPSPKRGKRVKEYAQYDCCYCGKHFERVPWYDNLCKSKGVLGVFCSRKCSNKHIKEKASGKNNKLYVGGPKTYRGRGWLDARAKATKRDNGICQSCGKHIGTSIPVHHIKPFRMFSSITEANHIDNLVCLCQPCHMKADWKVLKNS